MRQGFFSEHWADSTGNPGGGVTSGRGFTISWQNGPLGRGDDRREPNGAFVEDIINAAMDRLHEYEDSAFACNYNREAIRHLVNAIGALDARTADREARQVEGTHAV